MTPDPIARIIERLDPVDREALERHLKDESIMGQLMCLQEIRQAIGDPHGKLMQDEVVERVKALSQNIEKLRQENTELRLSNQEMKDWIAGEVYQGEDWDELNSDYRNYAGKLSAGVLMIESAPGARLAEVRAAAIEEHANNISMSTAPSGDYLEGYNHAMQHMRYCANRIRQEAP